MPERTAEAVRLLEAAGYANVGKTNLHEFAYGITSENEHFGDVQNPLDQARRPGGSSGGSAAALAAGLCDAALGTDSAGSIRIPAACCGVVGFKPTHGLVPMDGCFPLAPSWDTAGPMARTVEDCMTMMEALSPFERVHIESLEEIRIGVAWLDDADSGVRERVAAVAERFPRRARLDFPVPEDVVRAVFLREAAEVHDELYPRNRHLYGANVRAKLEEAFRTTEAELAAGQEARDRYAEQASEACEGFDLLLVPTIGIVAPPLTVPEPDLREPVLRFTRPFNVLGWPVLALPCGLAESGLPASASLVGRAGNDALVLAAGEAIEEALRPPPRG